MIFAKKIIGFLKYSSGTGPWLVKFFDLLFQRKEINFIKLKERCSFDTRNAQISSYEWILKSTTNPQEKESLSSMFLIGMFLFLFIFCSSACHRSGDCFSCKKKTMIIKRYMYARTSTFHHFCNFWVPSLMELAICIWRR